MPDNNLKSLAQLRKAKGKKRELSYPYRLNAPCLVEAGIAGVNGDVGIELECEGRNLGVIEGSVGGVKWTPHQDGSLRANNGGQCIEYVLNKPAPYEAVDSLVNLMFRRFTEMETVLNESNRTSTHVHLNQTNAKVNELCSLVVLYGSIEDALVYWCGSHRVGNLFALRFSDCDWVIEAIENMFKTGAFFNIPENYRYLGLNLAALSKFGSLEFRALRGVTEPNTMKKWINALWRIQRLARTEYKNPENIVRDFSGLGPRMWLDKLLGRPLAEEVWEAALREDADPDRLIWEGMRRMQPIIYSLPWGELMEDIERQHIPDPFASPTKKAKRPRFGEAVADGNFVDVALNRPARAQQDAGRIARIIEEARLRDIEMARAAREEEF